MENYNDRFKELISDKKYIENAVGERLLLDNRSFRQCYKEKDSVRKCLPPFWFCDPEGNVISIAKDKAVWLIPENNNGRAAYHFVIHSGGEVNIKIIRRATLSGIVWGVYRYGKAAEILEREGIFGFGTNSNDKLTVSCHHKDGDKTNDNYNNLEFATNKAHLQTIHKVPTVAADNEEQILFMQKISAMATEEEPERVTLLFADDAGYKEIMAVKEDDLPESIKRSVADCMLPAIMAQYIKAITKQYGADYFNESRLIYIIPMKRFLKVHFQNNRYAVSIPSIEEIRKQDFISC